MTLKQRILKAFYPLLIRLTRAAGKNDRVLKNEKSTRPPQSFYDLSVTLNNGQPFSFDGLKGKKVLLVNTASDCGYTAQYESLQKLYERFENKLVIIGFPANDFKEQEKGTDNDIAAFCKLNYGVSFPLAQKSRVVNSEQQNPVFRWLTSAQQNGWNKKQPSWNFSKYLVDEQGVLSFYFDPSVTPDDPVVVEAIRQS